MEDTHETPTDALPRRRVAAPAYNGAVLERGEPTAFPAGLQAAEIVAGLTEAIVVVDAAWRILYLNSEAARIVGDRPEKPAGSTYWEVWVSPLEPDIQGEYRRVMDERVRTRFEHRDGSDNWFDVCAFPCGAGVAICTRDITEEKRTKAQLLRREKELTDFVENAAMPLHWVAADGTILWANEAELKFLGYSREEYIGRNIADFHVDPAVIADILGRLETRQELDGYEARVRAKDGSVRYVALTSNVYWDNGQFIHTRCFTRDITEQKRTAELQERLAAIVESSDDAIVSKDLDGIIRSWNRGAERIFGYKADEIIGQPISILAVPGRGDEIPNILDRIRRGKRVDHYETRRRTKDGRVLAISLTVSPIRDASGTIVGASKIARDITDRVRAEEALRETNAALVRANTDLEQFAYSASHDLQEPLRMISTYSSMLKRKFGKQLGPDGDEYIRYTVDGAIRMQQLISDLLAYTQAAALAEEDPTVADGDQALRDALDSLRESLTSSGAAVEHTALPRVRMHQFQLEQVLQNLISNAIRYRREEPPQIQIAAERQDSEWLFSVRDNGIGIDPKYKERIFGIFKRLHSAADYPGSGIGLAICQRIIHRIGGRIWVESELGRGSTFFFTAPAADRQ
jgi:PAS domain S-box-containing protein